MNTQLICVTSVSALFTIAGIALLWFRIHRNKTKQNTPTLRVKEKLPAEREGMTHRFEIGGRKCYLTYSEYEDGRLGEIFLKIDKEGGLAHGLANCFSIAVSVALQHGVSFGHLYSKFSYQQFKPDGFTNQEEVRSAKSIVDYVFRWLSIRYDEYGIRKIRDKKLVRKAGLLVKE